MLLLNILLIHSSLTVCCIVVNGCFWGQTISTTSMWGIDISLFLSLSEFVTIKKILMPNKLSRPLRCESWIASQARKFGLVTELNIYQTRKLSQSNSLTFIVWCYFFLFSIAHIYCTNISQTIRPGFVIRKMQGWDDTVTNIKKYKQISTTNVNKYQQLISTAKT